MGVDLCGADVFVTQQFLHSAYVVATIEQMRGERVAQGVAGRAAVEIGFADRDFDGPLHAAFVNVVSADPAGSRIRAAAVRREHVLPDPLARGVGVLPLQRVG